MAADSVTPKAGIVSVVAVGGTPVVTVGPGPNGGFITNPASKDDQGIAAAEVLYVSPVGSAGLAANGTTFALQPGQSWPLIAGQTTNTSVNANTGGHKFSVVQW